MLPKSKVRADYGELDQAAQSFRQRADSTRQTLQSLRDSTTRLEVGDWIGRGAQQFYREMNGEVLPAMQRLVYALETASQVTQKINRVMKQAEVDAAAVLQPSGLGDAPITKDGDSAGSNSGSSNGGSSHSSAEQGGSGSSASDGDEAGSPSSGGRARLSRQDAVALRIYTREKYDDNPYLTAEQLQAIHRATVLRFDNIEGARRFFDRAAKRVINEILQQHYAPLLEAMQVNFRDGTGKQRTNLHEVVVNLLLVQQGIRPAFLLQWIDYDEADREAIKDQILGVIHGAFEDGAFALKEIDQGLLVVDASKLRQIAPLIKLYEQGGAGSEEALGRALGYPAAGEIETEGERHFAHILTPDGGDVMSNVCADLASVANFRRLYKKVSKTAKRILGIDLLFEHSQPQW